MDTQRWLRPFFVADALTVAGWVRNATDAYHLAPRTWPPITEQRVREWGGYGCEQLVLIDSCGSRPVAYGELNLLSSRKAEYWLGHLIVDPDRRGMGLGRELTSLLLKRAFEQKRAKRVSLVVFSDNRAAVECYKASGMQVDGWEMHDLPPYGRRERLLRMAVNAE